MNYEQMSDFDINKAVAVALGYKYIGRGSIDDADGVYHVVDIGGRRTGLPDYCNDPSLAWPIILKNKIRISPIMLMSDDNGEYIFQGKWEAGTLWDECGAFYNSPYFCHEDESPLRAAMIVFLMMNEK